MKIFKGIFVFQSVCSGVVIIAGGVGSTQNWSSFLQDRAAAAAFIITLACIQLIWSLTALKKFDLDSSDTAKPLRIVFFIVSTVSFVLFLDASIVAFLQTTSSAMITAGVFCMIMIFPLAYTAGYEALYSFDGSQANYFKSLRGVSRLAVLGMSVLLLISSSAAKNQIINYYQIDGPLLLIFGAIWTLLWLFTTFSIYLYEEEMRTKKELLILDIIMAAVSGILILIVVCIIPSYIFLPSLTTARVFGVLDAMAIYVEIVATAFALKEVLKSPTGGFQQLRVDVPSKFPTPVQPQTAAPVYSPHSQPSSEDSSNERPTPTLQLNEVVITGILHEALDKQEHSEDSAESDEEYSQRPAVLQLDQRDSASS